MKKVLYIVLLSIFSFATIFADFEIETSLSTSKQEAFKQGIEKVYKQFETNLDKLTNERQQANLEIIIGKINELLPKQKDDTTIFILLYLKYLLQEKLELASSIDISGLLQLEEEDKETIEKETIECAPGYTLLGGECTKQQEQTPIVIYIPTTPSNNGSTNNNPTCSSGYHLEGSSCISNTKTLSIQNGTSYQTWTGTNWTESVTCNSGYEVVNSQCLLPCGFKQYREGNTCVNEVEGVLTIIEDSFSVEASILAPSTSEASVLRFSLKSDNNGVEITDIFITNTESIQLSDIVRSSSLYMNNRSYAGTVISGNKIHFALGNGLIVKSGETMRGDIRIALYDSQTKTNVPLQFSLNSDGITTDTNSTVKTSSVSSNKHLLARSKPYVAMSNFTTSISDIYRFTITADSNRKIILDDIDLQISGSADLTGGKITIYRDSQVNGNEVFYKNVGDSSWNRGSASLEIAASQTVTFYVTLQSVTADNTGKNRQVQITGLKYHDDVANPVIIEAANRSTGIPTNANNYTY